MATLLPPGEIQFISQNGDPLAGGTVQMLVPNTLTPKDTWQDSGQAVLNTNPIVLDAAGRAIIYGSGVYRQILRDASGNLIWDQLTADTAVGGIAFGGVSTGTPNAQVIAASSFSQQDGQVVDFIAGFTNSGSLTLNLGGGPIPVLRDSPVGPVPLTGGEVVADNAISVLYEASRGAFHLLNAAVGTMSSQNANAVAITGGAISGVTISASTILIKQAADPAPTVEGDLQWSTLFNNLKVGDGAATQRFWSGPAPGAIFGCSIANNASDATNDIDFAAGTAVDSTNAFYMAAPALTKRLDATWVVGTNQGGLFSGSIANTTYHCFIIMRPDTGVVDAGFDTSTTAANRPAAYTYYRRIGSILRESAAIVPFVQTGDAFLRVTPVNAVNTNNPGTSAVLAPVGVPLGLKLEPSIAIYSSLVSLGGTRLIITSPDQADIASTTTVLDASISSASTATNVGRRLLTDTSARIRYRFENSAADLGIRITSHGWYDDRGRTG